MIEYQNIKEAIKETIQRVRNQGKKKKAGIWQATELFQDQEMLVLINEIFQVPVPDTISMLTALCKPDRPWAEDHFKERMEGVPSNPGRTYQWWPWNTFKDKDDPYQDGKKFSHTYQERFWPKHANREKVGSPKSDIYRDNKGIRYRYGDLNDVITQLKENPLTRQAYLPIFFPEDTGAVHKQRVPCTLGYYFYIDNEQIHINYLIRSCDILRHFKNDIYLTSRLLQHVAKELGLQVGKLTFICFNLHLFVNDLYTLKKQGKWEESVD